MEFGFRYSRLWGKGHIRVPIFSLLPSTRPQDVLEQTTLNYGKHWGGQILISLNNSWCTAVSFAYVALKNLVSIEMHPATSTGRSRVVRS